MPAQRFFLSQVPGDSCLEVSLGATGVDIPASRKQKVTEAPNAYADGSLDVDPELVGDCGSHSATVR